MVAKRIDLEEKIIAQVQTLPDDALPEVVQFLEYQRFKTGQQERPDDTPYRPVALGGLWAGHDLSEEEIDEVRREVWAGFGERDI